MNKISFKKILKRKSKANAILTVFIFGISLLILCVFGVDSANIVSTKNRLQQVTEYIAMEMAAYSAPNILNQNSGVDIGEIIDNYEEYYGTLGSGLLNLDVTITQRNGADNNVAIQANTTSQIMPIFLKFIGIQTIQIHARAYALSEQNAFDLDINDNNGATHNFDIPIVSKNMDNDGAQNIGDFSIQQNQAVGYPDITGIFVFGTFNGNVVDIGDRAINTNIFQVGDANGNEFNCVEINPANDPVIFDLSNQNKSDNTRRIDGLMIFEGSFDAINPCGAANNFFDPSVNPNLNNIQYQITTFNNVSLISRNEFLNFAFNDEVIYN